MRYKDYKVVNVKVVAFLLVSNSDTSSMTNGSKICKWARENGREGILFLGIFCAAAEHQTKSNFCQHVSSMQNHNLVQHVAEVSLSAFTLRLVYSANLGAVSEERGGRFHLYIATIKAVSWQLVVLKRE